MLFTERMKKIELLILKSDVDRVMRFLGFAGCLQLIAEGREQRETTPEEREMTELKARLVSLGRFLGLPEEPVPADPSVPAPERTELGGRTQAVLDSLKGIVEEEARLVQRRLELKQTEDELSGFSRLKVAFGDLENLSYLVIRVGSVQPERLADLTEKLSKRAVVMPLDRPGHFIAAAPKKGRWALDTELGKAEFQAVQLPPGMKGVPSEMLRTVEAEIAEVDAALKALEERKAAERDARAPEIRFLLSHIDMDAAIDAVKQGFASTGATHRVTGWIPQRRFQEVARGLERLTQGRMALRSYDPEELPEVKDGKVKVPVSTPHGRLVSAFDRMVFSYSTPVYGSVDPTPFVTVIFPLLFGIMFGDVGQGLVGLLIGLLINSGWIRSFEGYRRKSFGTTFILAGCAAIIAGFLYGSFFANEELLVPVTRWVTTRLTGAPMDRIIALGGFQKIVVFFGVTIGIGALVNSAGLVINIVNLVRRRKWEEALLSKTGIAGAAFFWYLLFVIVRVLLGGRIVVVDYAAIALPLLAIFCKELIEAAVARHRPLLKEGAFAFIMGGIAEVLESAIYYVSNSVSFLRVAAFGLAHTVLSQIIFLLADMVAGGSMGIVWKLVVVLIGNTIIVVLEGLIVTIQVVRLQYYEFFSKFFNESGEEFSPFILRTSGGLR
jgi:V/A-type H+/Na+-transporting ATPase subunit I